jgi:Family of unknown function (DUF5715)
MRRRWVGIAVLQGILLPFALPAAHTHSHAKKPHASGSEHGANAAKPHRSRHHTGDSVGNSAPDSAQARGEAALRRAKRGSPHLQTTQPVMTALIDPVPQGHFPVPPPLKGSHDSLVRQNVRSNEEGLTRIQDDADLMLMRRGGELVALPTSSALVVDERLPANRRYCRGWTAQFLSDLSRVHYGRFHRSLQVNSAVRTVEYQRHLERVNGNAAPAEGDDASPHLTGATIDIAKKGLSMEEVGWMRAYLAPLQAAGKIEVEEEFYQACFHITVYRSYWPEARGVEAQARGNAHQVSNAALLAAQVR